MGDELEAAITNAAATLTAGALAKRSPSAASFYLRRYLEMLNGLRAIHGFPAVGEIEAEPITATATLSQPELVTENEDQTGE